MGDNRLRVLAVDDSAVMREVLRTIFEQHRVEREAQRTSLPAMELCGVVCDGFECLDAVERLQPDAIVLDLEMPRMDGLGVLARLRAQAPGVPVILCSASTERGAKSTLEALALGAKDYVMKPSLRGTAAAAMESLKQQLLPKLALFAQGAGEARPCPAGVPCGAETQARVEVLVLGVSTGGPAALELMLPMLPRSFAVPVLVVQHMPRLFTGALAERLHRLCRMPVREATHGALVKAGTIWLAPGDAHLEVATGTPEARLAAAGAALRLHHGPALNSCKPSVDYLFRSAAEVYGAGTLALVMTGMGSDGLDGARAVKRAGGCVLAQDQVSSAVWGMPGRVAEAGLADAVVPLAALAAEVMQRVQQNRGATPEPPRLPMGRRMEGQHGLL